MYGLISLLMNPGPYMHNTDDTQCVRDRSDHSFFPTKMVTKPDICSFQIEKVFASLPQLRFLWALELS